MKIILLASILLLAGKSFAQTVAFVHEQISAGNYITCFVASPQKSYAGRNVLDWSTNGMSTFTYNSGYSNGNLGVSDIYFIDEMNGFLVTSTSAANEYVWKTTNGGVSWQQLNQSFSPSSSFEYSKVGFSTINIGYAISSNIVKSTTNGGASWGNQVPNSATSFKDLDFKNTLAWVCGTGGKIIKTTNGGDSWTTLTTGTTQNLTAIQFLDQYTGYAFGNNGTVIKTTDGGITWGPFITNLPTGTSTVFEAQFTNPMNGYVSRNDGFYHSTDGGSTWNLIPVPAGVVISDFHLLNSNLGLATYNTKLYRIDGNCTVDSTSVSASASNEYIFGNDTLTTSGVYTKVFANQLGCDSIVTLNLSICSPSDSTFTVNACGSFELNGQTYNATNVYTQIIPNATGCDSTITLILNINTVPLNSITENNGTLLADDINATAYQWMDCGNGNMEIPGETSLSFTPDVTGSYALIIENGVCIDTSACLSVSVSTNDLNESIANRIQFYPNPANDFIQLTGVEPGNEIRILSVNGSVVSVIHAQSNEENISVHQLENGVYFIHVYIQDKLVATKKMSVIR